MPLVHHELCFGCGRTNLFGLLLELERTDEGAVAGRCFIKQDHQGPEPGFAHEGIIATALSEAMALACGQHARPRTIEVVLGSSPVYLRTRTRAAGRRDASICGSSSERTLKKMSRPRL